jgi:mannose-6-phosphate isomerase-like protein (cupin superfamily)
MDAFELSHVIEQRERADRLYLEFLRVPSLSVGLYRLPANGTDPQQPHTEDEVYYVIGGRAHIRVGDENQPVESGTVVYVAAEVEHRFHSIVEDLTTLVFFAPAEYSRGRQPDNASG